MTETAVASARSNLEAMVAEKDKQLTKARKEVERVKVEFADVEARVVLEYMEDFENTPEYMYPINHFMTASREQLVERIGKTHLEWDISFLRYALRPSYYRELCSCQNSFEC
ncbi:hypothetical protein Adt_11517 [Abeliophyllum distichum]|uniref:Uncharacterized protein n=1 Tax=Abeliophyllum distichum TaxID=126358 RepID=A0ABD1UP13_9LAMI